MIKNLNIVKLFKLLLWLTAIHSFLVGLLLVFLPSSAIEYFGFERNDNNFFRVQAGVFHIVMSIFYVAATANIRKQTMLIKLIISTKFLATIFLILYYIIICRVAIILISGIGDFIIGSVILLLLYYLIKDKRDLDIVR